MESTVIILGARSLVGPYLLERLAMRNLSGEAVGRGSEAPEGLLPGGFRWRRLDAERPGNWHADPDSVVLSLIPLWRVSGLLPRLRAARQLIAVGSTSVFAKTGSSDPAEQQLAHDLADAEATIQAFGRQTGLSCTILRPTLIYDGFRDANVTAIARFAHRYGFFPVCAPANGLRQPVHADDVAQAMVSAIGNPAAAGEAFDVPGGETLTYREMVRRIFQALGQHPRIPAFPPSLLRLGLACVRRVGGVRYSPAMFMRMNQDLAFDASKARKSLNYAARPFGPDFSRLSASSNTR